MTADRAYRRAMTEPDAVAELQRCAGTQFDPRVVAALRRFLLTSTAELARADATPLELA